MTQPITLTEAEKQRLSEVGFAVEDHTAAVGAIIVTVEEILKDRRAATGAELTENESGRLDDIARKIHASATDEYDTAELLEEVRDIVADHLAAAVTFQLADVTFTGLPLPSVSFGSPTTPDEFKATIAAMPGVTWEPHIAGSSEYVTGEYAGFRVTVWAPRVPVELRPPPRPAYVETLLREARS